MYRIILIIIIWDISAMLQVSYKLQVTSAKLQVPGKKQVVNESIKQNSTKY